MSEEDLKIIISKYQQKTFELYNSNIVLESQIEKLNKTIVTLSEELEKMKKNKKDLKQEEDFS
jgi:cell division protein FtsB